MHLSPKVKFLGHKISEGIIPLSERVNAVSNFKKHKTVKELQKFLGMINFFYRQFIPKSADLQEPIYKLLRSKARGNNCVRTWTDNLRDAVNRTKKCLVKAASDTINS